MEMKRRIRPELEGLRTIAALLVAIYHIWFNRVSGGVDVFFVVSGFLITTSLLSMYRKNGKILYFSYIVKLMKRLLPTAWLIGITTVIASLYILPVFNKQQNISEFLASAFYFQNWRLSIDSVDYLAQNNTASPFQHFWALSIQFQFYLVWLLVFFVAINLLRFVSGNNIKRMLIVVISVLAVASFGYSIYLTAVNQPVAYYHTFTRVWEFGIGGIVALTIHNRVVSPRVAWFFGWLGLIGLISCGILLQVSSLFPGYAALWPVMSAVLIIVAGNYSTNFSAFRLLSWKPLVKFGSISYAFYLWHWPLLIFYYALFETETVSLPHGLAIMLVAAIFAYVTIYGFELPIRNVQLSVWKTASVIVVLSGVIWMSTFAYQENYMVNPMNSELLGESFATHPGAADYLDDGRLTPANEFDEAYLPSLEFVKQDRSEIYEDKCLLGKGKTEPKLCEYGELTDYDYTVALVGGSHSAHWQPMLVELAKAHNLKIVTYLKGNCRFTENNGAPYEDCDEWFANVKKELVKDKPDLIFTIGDVGSTKDKFDQVDDGFIDAWKFAENEDMPLFLVRDTPWYDEVVLKCLGEHADDPENCKAKQSDVIRDVNPLTQVDYMPESATTIDLTDYFCDGESCHYVVGNVVTHFDSNHLTATFSRSFASVFEEPVLEALRK
ncbi:acyltransferase family protein [Planococcus sp. YIM B11945]|uniref:acyltransferase family protein n=1 Tax=Planococcus sp. YIM B11945 TaxID=3435410 RepID=UPI003D7F08F1